MSKNLPKKTQNLSMKYSVIDLLDSIAQEEAAVSTIICAEAEKIKAFVGKNLDFPSNPSTKEIILFNETVNKMMDSLLMTEWLLFRKLDSIIQIDIHKMEDDDCPEMEIDSKDSFWEDDDMSSEASSLQAYLEIENIDLIDKGKNKKQEKENNNLQSGSGDEDDVYW